MDKLILPPAAGVMCNEAEQLRQARLKTEPPSKDVTKPYFPLGTDKRSLYPNNTQGWNPVAWSDYPKQPMWTVPIPKIPAPIVSTALPDLPDLPCHRPPTEHWTPELWMPDYQVWNPNFNPYVDEHNMPFKHLVGPPTLPQADLVERLHCPK